MYWKWVTVCMSTYSGLCVSWQCSVWLHLRSLVRVFCQPPTHPSSHLAQPNMERFSETFSALHAPLVTTWHFGGKKAIQEHWFGERAGGRENRKIDGLYGDGQVHKYTTVPWQWKANVGRESSVTRNQLKIICCRLRQQLLLRVNCLLLFLQVSALL